MITNYQSMGQARAVTSLETLALPGWFPLETDDDARLWLETLQAHYTVVRNLRDDHSE